MHAQPCNPLKMSSGEPEKPHNKFADPNLFLKTQIFETPEAWCY